MKQSIGNISTEHQIPYLQIPFPSSLEPSSSLLSLQEINKRKFCYLAIVGRGWVWYDKLCRLRRVLAAEAVKPPVFMTLSVPREFQVMKGCLFQPGIAMFLGSSSAILPPSTIFSRTAEPSTFCRPFSVDMCGIDVNLGCWLWRIIGEKVGGFEPITEGEYFKWMITTVYTYNQSPREVPN